MHTRHREKTDLKPDFSSFRPAKTYQGTGGATRRRFS